MINAVSYKTFCYCLFTYCNYFREIIMAAAEDAPYLCYKELLPPSSFRICAFSKLKVLHQSRLYLYTSSVSCFNVYKVNLNNQYSVRQKVEDGYNSLNANLSLKLSLRLFGEPSDMKCYPTCSGSDLLVLMLDGGKKLVVLQYDPIINFLHTLLMADIASISSTDVMGYGNSITLANSATNSLSSNEGCISVFTNASENLLPLDISPVQPISLACSVLYGHCLVFTLLPSETRQSENNAVHPHRIDPGQQQCLHDMKQQQTYALNPLTPYSSGSAASTFAVHGPILDISFLPRAVGNIGYSSRPTIAVLQQSGLVPIGHMASNNDRVTNTAVVTVLAVDADTYVEEEKVDQEADTQDSSESPRTDGSIKRNNLLSGQKLRVSAISVLWQQDRLPRDSIAVLPAPQWTGENVSPSATASAKESVGPLFGAVFVITMNAILVVSDESVFGVACNGFASVTVASHIALQPFQDAFSEEEIPEIGIELDGSRWVIEGVQKRVVDSFGNSGSSSWIYCLVGTLKDGRIMRTHVVCSEGFGLSSCRYLSYSVRFFMEEVAQSIRSSCFSVHSIETLSDSPTTQQLWFIGSANADSLLMRVESAAATNAPIYDASSSALGKRKLSTEMDPTPQTFQDARTEEEFLYGTLLAVGDGRSELPRPTHLKYDFSSLSVQIDDSIPNIGPVVDGFFSANGDNLLNEINELDWDRSHTPSSFLLRKVEDSANTAVSSISEKESKVSLQLCTGVEEQASLLRVYNGWPVSKVTSANFVGACGILSISVSPESSPVFNILLLCSETATRVMYSAESQQQGDHKAGELQIKEIDGRESGFISDCPTFFLGNLTAELAVQVTGKFVFSTCSNSSEWIIVFAEQVIGQGLRLVKLPSDFDGECDALQDILLSESIDIGGLGGAPEETIIAGDVTMGYVVLLSSLHTLYVLKYDDTDEYLALQFKKVENGRNPAVVSPSREDPANDEPLNSSSDFDSIFSSAIISISLFHGCLVTSSKQLLSVNYVKRPKSTKAGNISETEAEERYLYGGPVYNIIADEMDDSIDNEDNLISSSSLEHGDSVHLITTELDGTLRVIRLDDLACILCSSSFSTLADVVSVPSKAPADHPNNATAASRLIIETRFVKLKRKGHHVNDESASLCLALLFNTGDLAIYNAFIDGNVIYSFTLSDFTAINNYRRSAAKVRLRRGYSQDHSSNFMDIAPTPLSRGQSDSNTSDGGAVVDVDYLKSVDYLNRLGCTLNLVEHLDGCNALLVSCNNPVILFNCHGLPKLLPIGFPEAPYINCGQHVVVPCNFGGLQGIVTLWYEHEDIESLRQPGGIPRSSKNATVAFYQSISSLIHFPGGSISVNRVDVGKTIHKFRSLEKRTDDKTEQILLDKKTYVFSCSEEQQVEFPDNLISQEDLENEDIFLERYLPLLNSFSQASSELGPAPAFIDRSHYIVLSQGGAVVDKYAMFPGERVVDLTVLYFTLNKPQPPVTAGAFPTIKFEKRVFVAVCTSIADKRGEDSQGTGRLLFFGLDYGLFNELQLQAQTEADKAVTASVTVTSISASDTSTDAAPMDVSSVPADTVLSDSIDRIVPQINESNPPNSVVKASSSLNLTVTNSEAGKDEIVISSTDQQSTAPPLIANQDNFLKAITPKLMLLCSGPGPASVVKQLGDFLLSTVGATVFVYKINPATLELEQVSFYFAQFYITSVSVIKNYIILADMFHSLHLLYWRSVDFSLNLVSKDYDNRVYLSTSFIIDGTKLGIISGDDEGNIQILQENTKKMESIKGSRLLCLSDFHLGSDVSVLIPHDLLSAETTRKVILPNSLDIKPPPPPRTRKGSSFPLQVFGTRLNKVNSVRSTVLVGTMDGGVGLLIPLEEKIYRRLLLLQQIMAMIVPAPLHLNHRDYRVFKSRNFRMFKKKGLLDGCLLWRYNSLNPQLQEELASIVGVTSYAIKENLHDIDCLTNFF